LYTRHNYLHFSLACHTPWCDDVDTDGAPGCPMAETEE